jgi:hypothetical protein
MSNSTRWRTSRIPASRSGQGRPPSGRIVRFQALLLSVQPLRESCGLFLAPGAGGAPAPCDPRALRAGGLDEAAPEQKLEQSVRAIRHSISEALVDDTLVVMIGHETLRGSIILPTERR